MTKEDKFLKNNKNREDKNNYKINYKNNKKNSLHNKCRHKEKLLYYKIELKTKEVKI
jgi:hypothetical protein